jgi:hypothetical protein
MLDDLSMKRARRQMTATEREAVERLIKHACGDTGQCRIIADFLLSWWNGSTCGKFDLVDLWGLDEDLQRDAIVVITLAARLRVYPDNIGYEKEFVRLVREWRPHLK